MITAPSETGKSVYIKCLRIALFFKHIHPDDRKTIIRKGNKEGYLKIDLEDNSSVKLIFRPTNFEVELIEGGEVSSWREFFPNEIKERLGLVVNTDLQLILNLMDQESPMLFDGTSNEYNDEILGFYANHNDLLHRFDVLSEWESSINSSISNKKSTLKYIEDDMSRIPIIEDIDYLEESLSRCEKLNNWMKFLDSFIGSLDVAYSLVPGVEYSCDTLRLNFNYLTYLSKVVPIMDNAVNLECNYVSADLSDCKSKMSELEYLYSLLNVSIGLEVIEVPNDKIPLTVASDILDELQFIHVLTTMLAKAESLYNPPVKDIDVNYKEKFNQLDLINQLYTLVIQCEHKLHELDAVESSVLESRDNIINLKKEFKVCALCGTSLD